MDLVASEPETRARRTPASDASAACPECGGRPLAALDSGLACEACGTRFALVSTASLAKRRAWLLALAATLLAAGQGVFLLYVVARQAEPLQLRSYGGRTNALLTAFFCATVPLAVGLLLARGTLRRRPLALLRALALGWCAVVAAAFLAWLTRLPVG